MKAKWRGPHDSVWSSYVDQLTLLVERELIFTEKFLWSFIKLLFEWWWSCELLCPQTCSSQFLCVFIYKWRIVLYSFHQSVKQQTGLKSEESKDNWTLRLSKETQKQNTTKSLIFLLKSKPDYKRQCRYWQVHAIMIFKQEWHYFEFLTILLIASNCPWLLQIKI